MVLKAKGPVTVLQYGLSQQTDNIYGDASMTTIPALSNFANDYVFPYMPCYLSFANCTNTLAIIIKRSIKRELTLDGNRISVCELIAFTPKSLIQYYLLYNV